MTPRIADPPQPARFDGTYATIWSATLLFFAGFYTLLAPLPLYLERIGLADWQIGLVLGAFGVASLVGRPLAGNAADRLGPRPVLLGGALALLVGSVAVPATVNLGWLFLLRLLQAAGYVAFTTAGTALVIRLTPPDVRGRRLAIFGAAANVAIALTPALMSIALAAAPPATAFFVAGGLAAVAGAMVSGISLPPREESSGQRFERRALRRVGVPMLAAGLTGAGFAAFFQFAPLLAERHGGIAVGTLYGVYGVGIIAARVLTGPLIDRWQVGQTLTLATALMSAGLAGLAIGGPAFTLALAALLIAFGSGIAHPALLKHHAALLPHAPGQASAAFYLGFDLGIGLGSLLFGVLLELGGTGGLYAVAALLTVLVLPLARRLM